MNKGKGRDQSVPATASGQDQGPGLGNTQVRSGDPYSCLNQGLSEPLDRSLSGKDGLNPFLGEDLDEVLILGEGRRGDGYQVYPFSPGELHYIMEGLSHGEFSHYSPYLLGFLLETVF